MTLSFEKTFEQIEQRMIQTEKDLRLSIQKTINTLQDKLSNSKPSLEEETSTPSSKESLISEQKTQIFEFEKQTDELKQKLKQSEQMRKTLELNKQNCETMREKELQQEILEKSKEIEKLQCRCKTAKTLLEKKEREMEHVESIKPSLPQDISNGKLISANSELTIRIAELEKEHNEKIGKIMETLNVAQNQRQQIEAELKMAKQFLITFQNEFGVECTYEGSADLLKALHDKKDTINKEIAGYQIHIEELELNNKQLTLAKLEEVNKLTKTVQHIQNQLDKRVKTITHKNHIISKLEGLLKQESSKTSDCNSEIQLKFYKLEQTISEQQEEILQLNRQITESKLELSKKTKVNGSTHKIDNIKTDLQNLPVKPLQVIRLDQIIEVIEENITRNHRIRIRQLERIERLEMDIKMLREHCAKFK